MLAPRISGRDRTRSAIRRLRSRRSSSAERVAPLEDLAAERPLRLLEPVRRDPGQGHTAVRRRGSTWSPSTSRRSGPPAASRIVHDGPGLAEPPQPAHRRLDVADERVRREAPAPAVRGQARRLVLVEADDGRSPPGRQRRAASPPRRGAGPRATRTSRRPGPSRSIRPPRGRPGAPSSRTPPRSTRAGRPASARPAGAGRGSPGRARRRGRARRERPPGPPARSRRDAPAGSGRRGTAARTPRARRG